MENFTFKGGITRYWWMPLITGLLSIAIGIWCLCSPDSSLPVLAYVFAGVVIAAGIVNLAFAIANTRIMPGWGWPLALGLIEIIIGIWLLTLPESMLIVTFIYTVGVYLIFVTINAICESCMLYTYSSGMTGWLLALLLVTLAFAVIFLAGPVVGGVAVWLYIGISFITFGCYRIALSAKLRRLSHEIRI
ncbi:MAG: DUF308 domain-containing protein [Muribaculaceae bacterium]|jgi:uncharacterized membrane protein HdeD (DUF308 family)|nr:DUF308 domain-containing protein [Muribaculaceae bacterium]MCX4280935.1 DUF308 domain-containing protein [Muribaculaceae bacterium]ROS84014.1 hypothetical protein EEK90_06185 [Muribaculaceae bacterium Isolate-036 (Harlan)]RXE69422.1 hypothetical protein ED328_02420 [Muribaculaceae bacterium Isolate-001 (NCI)]HBY16053.1 hypothetical protein [Porphyromonadaceae bacterium]